MASDETSCKRMLSPKKVLFCGDWSAEGYLKVFGVFYEGGCCCTKCAVMTIARFSSSGCA